MKPILAFANGHNDFIIKGDKLLLRKEDVCSFQYNNVEIKPKIQLDGIENLKPSDAEMYYVNIEKKAGRDEEIGFLISEVAWILEKEFTDEQKQILRQIFG